MIRKLIRTGDNVAVVFDKQLLEQLGLDENSEVEVSTNGQTIVISPVRDQSRQEEFKKSLEKIDRQYGDLFRRLADS